VNCESKKQEKRVQKYNGERAGLTLQSVSRTLAVNDSVFLRRVSE